MSSVASAAGTAAEVLDTSRGRLRWQVAGVLAGAAAGLWCFREQLLGLYELWGDPTRSIGMLIPPVSALLAFRSWRDERWSGGEWWGLALIGAAMLAAMVHDNTFPFLVFSSASGLLPIGLLPAGPLICLYVSGVVVLFGGRNAWLKAAFPLLLLAFLNPVPGWFTGLVDLPLQGAAARAARAFAALLHVPVSEGTLQMMFSPALGMFIAPGCDGLRGAVTMGLLAAVSGHLYRLERLRWALFVGGALLLAYVLNLVRLCCVVIYYWCALRIPSIGAYGAQVDYAIGGTLFAVAAGFVLGLPRLGRRA